MVPHLLRLRNFMSYGDEPVTVDFTGIHLACLSGGNGHGKSALLDAITWALWGESRARREDDLVYRGSTTMEVELEFSVGGGRYRVLRKRALRPNSPSSASLELQVQGEGGFTSITGGTIRETEARLLDILKLSYKTFINSAFLLQGRADTFTSSTPAERKSVLGEILGLEQYDKLAEKARDVARTRALEARGVRERIAVEEGEVARRPTLRAELAELEVERDAAVTAVQATTQALSGVQAERERLRSEERLLDDALRKIEATKGEVARLQARRDADARAVREAEVLLADEGRIRAGVAELRRAREEGEQLDARLGRVRELERRIAVAGHEIALAEEGLRGEYKRLRAEAEKAARVAAAAPALRRQLEEYERGDARIPSVEAERVALARQIEALRETATRLQGENAALDAAMTPLRERLKLLQERGALCPVCKKPMEEEDRQRLFAEFKAEGVAKSDARKANDAAIAAAQRDIATLQARDKELAATLNALHKAAREMGGARLRLQAAEEAAVSERELQARAEALSRTLSSGDFAREARARMADVQAEMQAIGYDSARHAAVRARIKELSPLEEDLSKLDKADKQRESALANIAHHDDDLARRRQDLERDEQAAALHREALAVLPEIEARRQRAADDLAEAQRCEKALQEQVVTLRNRLSLLDAREEGLRDERAQLARLERESDAHKELSEAFGKAGIQAMIIDNALPELESSTNAILARMSDTGMQVRFSTQREGARKDVIETLDISIADANGTRPYEMYSGGEAFRVNFAVRVALSRLLAERAGAQLQMLVVDEGFGTQDAQGRERIVEAINGVAADFERILIVTHIDELKDLFTARIDVVKDTGGSRVIVTAA